MPFEALPSELWAEILYIAQSLPGYPIWRRSARNALRSRQRANAVLISCALVCKLWAEIAQGLLFRHVDLGTSVPESSPSGRTTQALASLLDVLSARPDLARLVRSLYIGLGLEITGHLGVFFVSHGEVADLMHLLELCPSLMRMDLVIGANLKAGKLTDRAVASLARLEVLSLNCDLDFANYDRFFESPPPSWFAHEVLHAASSSLVSLHLRIAAHAHVNDDHTRLDFPRLREIVLRRSYSGSTLTTLCLQSALQHRAPVIRTARLPGFERDLIDILPISLTELVLDDVANVDSSTEDALTCLVELRKLELLYGRTQAVIQLLSSVSRTLEHVTVPSVALSSEDEARAVADTVRGLPRLRQLEILKSSRLSKFVSPEVDVPVVVSLR